VTVESDRDLAGLSGHGVGKTIHEPPTIPNQFDRRLNSPLTEGLVITVEGPDYMRCESNGYPGALSGRRPVIGYALRSDW
jgi:Xaa-Pro aminopeptidase